MTQQPETPPQPSTTEDTFADKLLGMSRELERMNAKLKAELTREDLFEKHREAIQDQLEMAGKAAAMVHPDMEAWLCKPKGPFDGKTMATIKLEIGPPGEEIFYSEPLFVTQYGSLTVDRAFTPLLPDLAGWVYNASVLLHEFGRKLAKEWRR